VAVVDVAAVVVGQDHVVEELVASKADSVDLVCVLGTTIRRVVGCCSALFDRAACSLGRTCYAGEMQTSKPLLAGWKGDLDSSRRIWLVKHFGKSASLRFVSEYCCPWYVVHDIEHDATRTRSTRMYIKAWRVGT
jgi:hypothetical protein